MSNSFEKPKQPTQSETLEFDSSRDYLAEQTQDVKMGDESMTKESPEQAQTDAPRDIDSLTTRLEEYFYSQDDPKLQADKDIFLKNVNEGCEELLSLIRDYPDRFDLLFHIVSNRRLSVEDMQTLATNFRAEEAERLVNKEEVSVRTATNPLATDEEYRLGTYVESLEMQMRGAVVAFLNKGYIPMESGFLDPTEGSQYVGFTASENVDRSKILSSITDDAVGAAGELFKQLLKPPYIQNIDGGKRMQLILVPQDPNLSLDKWKEVWDKVAECVPGVGQDGNKEIINNGLQGNVFREEQEKLRTVK